MLIVLLRNLTPQLDSSCVQHSGSSFLFSFIPFKDIHFSFSIALSLSNIINYLLFQQLLSCQLQAASESKREVRLEEQSDNSGRGRYQVGEYTDRLLGNCRETVKTTTFIRLLCLQKMFSSTNNVQSGKEEQISSSSDERPLLHPVVEERKEVQVCQ